jgi:DNA-directed RNA polymerase subunit RPC12/RpoP
MPKGCKKCDNCGSTNNGPRSYVCKDCGEMFVFKLKSKEAKNTKIVRGVDWRTLQKGDRIKVSSGPYFVSKGEFIPMGYRGRFVVESLDANGILAWGLDKHQGFCHIYMAGDIQNKETGVWKTKHKMMKLKSKEVVE